MVSREPLAGYTQAERIAHSLARRISEGEFKAGERLESEQRLADAFGTSRGTIRRALAILQESDLVRTKPGSGSYVAFHGASLAGPRGWTAASHELGLATTTETLSVELIPTPESLQSCCLEPEVYRVIRRRLLDGEVLSLEISMLPANERIVTVMEFGLLGGSISKTLQATGMRTAYGHQDVSVKTLDRESAELANRQEGILMIRSERTGLSEDGLLVEYVESWLDPEHFSLHLTFEEQ